MGKWGHLCGPGGPWAAIEVSLWRAPEAEVDERVVVGAAPCARVDMGVFVVALEVLYWDFEGHGNGCG